MAAEATGEPVLAVFAHPDDPEIAAGGTLAKWAAAGRRVTLLLLTDGEKGSQDPAEDLGRLVALRREEQRNAAGRLGPGVDVDFFDLKDGELENTYDVRSQIARVIRRVRPEIVVCPDPTLWFYGDAYYNHADHRAAGIATLDAIAPGAGNPHFFPEQLGEGLQVWDVPEVWMAPTVEANHREDVTGFIETKIAALEEHGSQLGEDQLEFFRTWIPGQAEEDGRKIGVRHAEAFRVLRLG
jgi:LmbE family N-acetylglucosaminyl deacetylase